MKKKGIFCYLPLVPKARMHHSTKIVSQVPFLSSYVFLCLDDEERRELKKGEKQILQIEILRDEKVEMQFISELNILKKCEELAKAAPVLINPEIVTGDDVLIISGPLKDLQTKVIRRCDEKEVIIINLPILNTHVEYPVSAEELRKIT